MELFELDKGLVKFAPQALILTPFKALWDRDKSKTKEKATNELAFVYFLIDYRSDFNNVLDEESRAEAILEVIPLKGNPLEDKKIKEAIEFYKELQKTPATQMLDASYKVLGKLEQYFLDVDFTTLNEKGTALLHDPNKVNQMLKTLDQTFQSLEKAKDRVKREIESKNEQKGEKNPALFEDGL